MPGFPRPFASEDADDETFDDYDEFVPEHLPEPGPFLDGADVLTGEDHVAFHRLTREVFEERGVYDATFGYNLARLNLDSRHPDAGFRYGIAPTDSGGRDDEAVLLAEFTPTTKFCPQSDSLTIGALRAWNGLADRHEYDRVSVGLSPMHHQSTEINRKLGDLEGRLLDGEVDADRVDEDEYRARRATDISQSGDDGPSAPF